MRPLIALLVASFVVGSCACDKCDGQVRFDPNKKVDGHTVGGVDKYNQGRIPEMPSGPNKLQVWLVLSDNWQKNALEYSIAQHVASDPRMQQIKAGTYFNYYTVSNPKFSQSGLISAVGTATPIVVVTQNDGAIARDGTGGTYVNAQSCPQTADGVVDLICDSIAAMNPPPRVEGQTNASTIIRESDCPDCTPEPLAQPMVTPNSGGTLTPIKPRKAAEYFGIGLAIIAASLVVAGGVIAVVHHVTKVKANV